MDLNLLPPAVIESLLEQRIAKTHVYSTLLPKLLARLLQNLPGTGAERTLALLRRSVPFCGIQALRCIPVACLNVLEQAGNDDLPEDVVVALAEAVDDEPSILSTLPFWTKLRIYPSNHSAFLSDMKCLVNSFAQDYRVLPSAPTFEDVRDLRSFKTIADSVGSNNGLWDGLTNLIETCFRENADKSEAIAFLRWVRIVPEPLRTGLVLIKRSSHCLLSHLPLESTLDSFITLAHLLNKPRLDLSATRAFFDRVPKDCVSYARAGIILSTERAMQLLVGQFLDTVGSVGMRERSIYRSSPEACLSYRTKHPLPTCSHFFVLLFPLASFFRWTGWHFPSGTRNRQCGHFFLVNATSFMPPISLLNGLLRSILLRLAIMLGLKYLHCNSLKAGKELKVWQATARTLPSTGSVQHWFDCLRHKASCMFTKVVKTNATLSISYSRETGPCQSVIQHSTHGHPSAYSRTNMLSRLNFANAAAFCAALAHKSLASERSCSL